MVPTGESFTGFASAVIPSFRSASEVEGVGLWQLKLENKAIMSILFIPNEQTIYIYIYTCNYLHISYNWLLISQKSEVTLKKKKKRCISQAARHQPP